VDVVRVWLATSRAALCTRWVSRDVLIQRSWRARDANSHLRQERAAVQLADYCCGHI